MLLYSKIMVKTGGNGSRKCSFNGKTAEEIVALNQLLAIRKIILVIDLTHEFKNLKVAFIMIYLLLIKDSWRGFLSATRTVKHSFHMRSYLRRHTFDFPLDRLPWRQHCF